jgi:hypothetical protein
MAAGGLAVLAAASLGVLRRQRTRHEGGLWNRVRGLLM